MVPVVYVTVENVVTAETVAPGPSLLPLFPPRTTPETGRDAGRRIEKPRTAPPRSGTVPRGDYKRGNVDPVTVEWPKVEV